MSTLTIFTPTYNRVKFLPKCYESLLGQTSRDFIWQIVDDGSTDGTEALIQAYIAEGKLAIDYCWQENGGKASAINRSLEKTDTPFWLCLDSDDFLFPTAVEQILAECERIRNDEKVAGVFAVRSDINGLPMTGKDVPEEVVYATQLDIRYRYCVEPEYAQVYKTGIISQYRFPQYPEERFMTESWMQDQIDQRYQFRIMHGAVMACEYLPDGYTNNYYRLIRRNPRGFLDFYAQRVELCRIFKPRLTAAIMYNAVFASLGDRRLKRKKHWLIALTWLPGKMMKRKLG